MKKAIELADTTFRAHKKRDGTTALHLKTYLIVYADAAFRAKIQDARASLNLEAPDNPCGIQAFMKQSPRCWLQLPNRRQDECEIYRFGRYPASRLIERPANGGWVTHQIEFIADEQCTLFYFWVRLVVADTKIERLSIAKMKLLFHINFPGRLKDKITIRKHVPVTWGRSGW